MMTRAPVFALFAVPFLGCAVRAPAPAAQPPTAPAAQPPAAQAPAAQPPAAPARTSGNPILRGWYADPEIRIFAGRYWVYPTTSLPYERQTFFEAFSSEDLATWRSEGKVLDLGGIPWSTNRAAWAPSVVGRGGRYYFYFSAGDGAGIGVAVADAPAGPFRDPIGAPLVKEWPFGAQPIDPYVFQDDDGRAYLYFGGRRHLAAAPLGADLTSLAGPFKELTPPGYVEGPVVIKRAGRYYLMWSEGNWTDSTYSAAYGVGDGPLGPFRKVGKLLESSSVANGPGHHSVVNVPGTDEWYVVYHRRPPGERDGNHRVTCIDRLEFAADGTIRPVVMTDAGVVARRLSP